MVRVVRATDPDAVTVAARAVRDGGLVVYPTDTLYGLGADPFDDGAVRRVFEVKGRGVKPLPVLVSSLEAALELVRADDRFLRLARRFWPGPLTIVAPDGGRVSRLVLAGGTTLGVRMPAHPFALRLIEECGGALVGTSANVSGRRPPASLEDVDPEIMEGVDVAVDGGRVLGTPSTVVDLSGDRPVVLRVGALGVEEVLGALE